ncbi:MAG: SDR family oxidoreductase [Mycobacteriales bacterium]
MDDYRSMFDLSGQTVLLTGAGRGGLGYFTALALADLGASLVVSDVAARGEDLTATVKAVQERGRENQVTAVACDVSNSAEVDALVQQAHDRMGSITVLVHHAGVMLRGPAIGTDLADWQRVIDINLTGTWLLNRAVAVGMLAAGRGSIVNTSTLYAQIVGPIPESAYYASKAGVANLSRGLAMEWGPQGVRVNCLAPGVFYPTEMTAPLAATPERLQQMGARTMVGRLGDPEADLAGVVAFLASEASRYVTGQVIYADGGWSAW